MRLEPIPENEMDDRQRALQADMADAVEKYFGGFTVARGDGALVGPFPTMLRWPAWGEAAWAQAKSLLEHTVLPKPAHEIVILVTGAQFRAVFELYAHERVALNVGLPAATVATIVAGQRPGDLDPQQAAAYDLASALVRGGPVPDVVWQVATDAFGDEGAAEIAFLTAGYSAISVLLNAFAMPAPDAAM